MIQFTFQKNSKFDLNLMHIQNIDISHGTDWNIKGRSNTSRNILMLNQEPLSRFHEMPQNCFFRAKYFTFSMYFQLAACFSKFWIVVNIISNNCQWTQLTCMPKNGQQCIKKWQQVFCLEVIFTLSQKQIKMFGLNRTKI